MVASSWAIDSVLRPPQLAQSIALAMLLHIWLVLVLGSAPGGMARPGEGAWGRLGGVIDVRLSDVLGAQGEIAEPPVPTLTPAPPLTKTGPVGTARQERYGGAVRAPTLAEPEAASPGAARLGRWNSQAGDAEATTPPNRITALPRAAIKPMPAAADLALQPMPIRPPAAALPVAPIAPIAPTAPIAPAAPPTPAPMIEPTPVTAPAPAVVAAPLPSPEQEPAPTAAAPVARAEPKPKPTPAPTPPTASTPAPPQPAALQPTPKAAAPIAASPGSTTSTPSPSPSSSLSPSSYPAPAGSPDAGSRVGLDVATPLSTPPTSPPPTAAREPLNLSLPRGAATSRQGASGLLSMVPIPPERKTRLEQEMEAAAKADCRKAHAGAGLLAIVPLVFDAARDKGCRW